LLLEWDEIEREEEAERIRQLRRKRGIVDDDDLSAARREFAREHGGVPEATPHPPGPEASPEERFRWVMGG
jgi:hypothetical protein